MWINVIACCLLIESVVAEIQKKVDDAFAVFDHERSNAVDVR